MLEAFNFSMAQVGLAAVMVFASFVVRGMSGFGRPLPDPGRVTEDRCMSYVEIAAQSPKKKRGRELATP